MTTSSSLATPSYVSCSRWCSSRNLPRPAACVALVWWRRCITIRPPLPSCNLKVTLATAHRRGHFSWPLQNMWMALPALAGDKLQVEIVYPGHLNPNVQELVYCVLSGQERIRLITPSDYGNLTYLMARCYLILTDSGRIQEDAPALGVAVLVMRRDTERPEAVEAGSVKIVGTDTNTIIAEVERLLHDEIEYQRMAHAVSLYGDGDAAERIVGIILERIGRNRERPG